MKKTEKKLFILGVLNVIAGVVLMAFLVMMQNLLAFVLGIFFVIFGVALCLGKSFSKLLYWGIIPLTVLYSNVIVMLGANDNVPRYYQVPLFAGVMIFLVPLWLVIAGNIHSMKRRNR